MVIMTSNLGTSSERHADLEALRESALEAVRRAFKPEFLNRIDDVIVFHPLGQSEMLAITRLQLRALERKLADRRLRLQVDDEAAADIARRGFDPVYGARPLKRLIQRELESSIARAILEGDATEERTVRVSLRGGELRTEVVADARVDAARGVGV
jgi:ATP-dependent Clp protease ATP-binding subunit ClpB